MYIAKRTYPELLPASSYLASRVKVANTLEYVSLLEYVNHDSKSHKMVFRPTSLDVVGCSDASYGSCVGFPGAFFIFISLSSL